MTWLTALAYLADVAVLGTYAMVARGGSVRPFHWANALGCFPIIGVEIVAGAWPPLVLTATFGALGWVGVVKR